MRHDTRAGPSASGARWVAAACRCGCGTWGSGVASGIRALLERRANHPLQMHTHVTDGRVDVQHLVFGALALVDDHHVRAPIEVGEGVGDARHFLAEGVVQCE